MWTSNDSVWKNWNKLRNENLDTAPKNVDNDVIMSPIEFVNSQTQTVIEGDLFVIAYELHRIADYLQQLEKRH